MTKLTRTKISNRVPDEVSIWMFC